MKKSLIAASASAVALAAMPAVGVFAGTGDVLTQVDTLEITIEDHCSFGHQNATSSVDVTGVAHATGTGTITGTWAEQGSTSTDPTDVPAHDTLSATMATGTVSNSIGTTTLGVYCNNEDGYTITTSGAGALSATGVDGTIPINNSFAADSKGWSYQVAVKTGSGWTQRGEVKNGHTAWAKATGTTGTDSPIANEIIAGSPESGTKTTQNTGDFYIITYGAGIDQTVAAGTYTGNITYTLAAL